MNVKTINVNGISKIKDAIIEFRKSKTVSNIPNGIHEYLNRVTIVLELEDVTSYELFNIKNFNCDFCITHKYITDKFLNGIKDTNLANTLKLYNTIINDKDINSLSLKNMVKNILPIGSMNYTILLKLTGYAISDITGRLDDFIKYNKFNSDEEFAEIFKNLFIESFDKNIKSKMDSVDTLYEFMKSEYDYEYSDGICTLASFESMDGNINFINTDGESLMNEISNIKNNKHTKLKEYYDSFTFIINSSFNVFLDLYLNTKDLILNYENFYLVYGRKEYLIDSAIINKYNSRIKEVTNNHVGIKKEILNSKEILPKFFYYINYIQFGSPIKYTIRVKEHEIENIFSYYQNNPEIDEIKNSILDSIKIVRSNLK